MTEKPNLCTATGDLYHIFPELETEVDLYPWLKELFPLSMRKSNSLIASLEQAGFREYIKNTLKKDESMRKVSSGARAASKAIVSIIEANKAEVFEYYAFRGEYRHAKRCTKVRNHYIHWTNPLKAEIERDSRMNMILNSFRRGKNNDLVEKFNSMVWSDTKILRDKEALRKIFENVILNANATGRSIDKKLNGLKYVYDAHVAMASNWKD